MNTPLISIITPCFNHGIYLEELIDSIQINKYENVFEHIIVNDGSTDVYTVDQLKICEERGIKVIHQKNIGLAHARNAGIAISNGKYILPLDADNKIFPEVFIKAAAIMNDDNLIDVLYTDAEYFGEKTGIWEVGDFHGIKIIADNYIDACSLIRKDVFGTFGLYDINMPAMGHEDWELWVRLYLNSRKFYYLNEIGYSYRVRSNAMTVTTTRPNIENNRAYIYSKYAKSISTILSELKMLEIDQVSKLVQFKDRVKNNRFKEAMKLIIGKDLFL